jgi:hypothetical protein
MRRLEIKKKKHKNFMMNKYKLERTKYGLISSGGGGL